MVMAAFVVADSLLQPSKTIGMRVVIRIVVFIVSAPNLYTFVLNSYFRRLARATSEFFYFVSIGD